MDQLQLTLNQPIKLTENDETDPMIVPKLTVSAKNL